MTRDLLHKNVTKCTCVAQSVKHLTSALVMISRLVSSSPAQGSVLTAQSLEPASDSVSPSLSVPPLLILCLSVFLSKINIKKTLFKNISKMIGILVVGVNEQTAQCFHVSNCFAFLTIQDCPIIFKIFLSLAADIQMVASSTSQIMRRNVVVS